jgi:hypothetical protein
MMCEGYAFEIAQNGRDAFERHRQLAVGSNDERFVGRSGQATAAEPAIPAQVRKAWPRLRR